MAMRILVPLLLLALPAQAQQLAMLRPFTVVEDPVVRLSDLFENAGPRAEAVLGPAPAPGQRLVVEAGQLLAIARRNGVEWRPSGGAERVVLERPGRPVAREEVLALLRAALRAQGMEEESELELQAFAPPLVPPESFVQMAIEQASLDPATQRFAATLAVMAEGMPMLRQRIAGRVQATAPMLVAVRRMAVGEVVRPQDVRVLRVAVGRLRAGAAERPEQVVGQALRRPASPDQPLFMADLAQPQLIARGATVTMLYDIPGMTLAAQGRAMEGAARGAVVPVMNLASRIVVEAQVVGPGRVRVGNGR